MAEFRAYFEFDLREQNFELIKDTLDEVAFVRSTEPGPYDAYNPATGVFFEYHANDPNAGYMFWLLGPNLVLTDQSVSGEITTVALVGMYKGGHGAAGRWDWWLLGRGRFYRCLCLPGNL